MADKVPNLSQSPPKQPKGPTVIDPTIRGPAGSVHPPGPTVINQQSLPTTIPSWMTEVENYLTRSGWTKLGTSDRGVSLWQDPLGTNSSGEKKPTVRLPIQGGGEEQIYQCILPPVVWNYTSEDAMTIQRYRDHYGQGLETLIKVKERELRELKERLNKSAEVA
jgi:hypothetical protein